MAKKPLPTPEQLRQLLHYEPETGKFHWRERSDDSSPLRRISRNWNSRFAGKEAFTNVSKRGYHTGVIFCVRYYAHRVAWAMHYGEWPDKLIDHIDGNPLNNRISNLRCVPMQENARNAKLASGKVRQNKTGCPGIWWDEKRRKYQAAIHVNRRKIYLGRFEDLGEAIAARKAAEREIGFHENHGRL